jgi:hypothetical protein
MKNIHYTSTLFEWIFIFSKKVQKKPAGKTAIPVKLNYHDEFRKISDEIMTNGRAYENLGELTKGIGPRFSATPGYARAVEWAEKSSRNRH